MKDWFKAAAERMFVDYEASKNISHQLTKGEAREASVVSEFLDPYLPKRYSIGSGIICDIDGNTSRQQDIVIYDEFNAPVLKNLQSSQLFFPESVYAVMEVKSTLTYPEIDNIAKKSTSVWSLNRTTLEEPILPTPNNSFVPKIPPILCLGLGFVATISLDNALTRIRRIRNEGDNLSHALSFLCILRDKDGRSGLVINVHGSSISQATLEPNEDSRLAIIEFDSPGDTLLHTYLLLMQHLRSSAIFTPSPKLRAYAEAGGSGIVSYYTTFDEAKGARVYAEGKMHDLDDLTEFHRLSIQIKDGLKEEASLLEWWRLAFTLDDDKALVLHDILRQSPTVSAPPTLTHETALALIERYQQGQVDTECEETLVLLCEAAKSFCRYGIGD